MTRREFLRMLAALGGGALAAGWGRTLAAPPLLSGPEPTPSGTATATPSPTAAATPAAPLQAASSANATAPELVTVKGDQFYYRGTRFPINGFNYYPMLHPWRTFNVGDWDPVEVRRELELAVALGANTVRIFIDYQFSLDNSRAQQPRDIYFAPVGEYVRNVREFLDIAGRLGLQSIVTLFDSLDWVVYQPQYHWLAEEYLKELIPAFVDDPRILCWDLQNEPDRAIVLVGNTSVIPFFQRMSALVRQLDPRHLQTIGWIDRARARYFPDLDDLLDFWCFHFYDKAENLNALTQFYKSKTNKPVLLEEYGLATGGPGADGTHTEDEQAAHYRTVLSTLDANNMCGSVLWTLLDFPQGLAGNPPSPNDSPENHFGVFRLDYSPKPAAVELLGVWKPKAAPVDVRSVAEPMPTRHPRSGATDW